MELVLDASYAVTWFIDTERTPKTDKLYEALLDGGRAFVPPVLHCELVNALLNYESRNVGSAADVDSQLKSIQLLPIQVEVTSVPWFMGGTVTLARKHRLSTYDACYLDMAVRLRLPLATLDEALITAAKNEKVKVL